MNTCNHGNCTQKQKFCDVKLFNTFKLHTLDLRPKQVTFTQFLCSRLIRPWTGPSVNCRNVNLDTYRACVLNYGSQRHYWLLRFIYSFDMRTKKRPKGHFTSSYLSIKGPVITVPSYNSAQSFFKQQKTSSPQWVWSWFNSVNFCLTQRLSTCSFSRCSHPTVPWMFQMEIPPFHCADVNIAGAGWSHRGQPSHGYADHIFFVQISHYLFLPSLSLGHLTHMPPTSVHFTYS